MNATEEKSTNENKNENGNEERKQRATFDGRLFLKVKLKSLAAEARIIRQEERKCAVFRKSLREHRVGTVRNEARHTVLAYGFLRGHSYREIEPTARQAPDWSKVEAMARKYGVIQARDASVPLLQEERENAEMLERLRAWIGMATV